MTKPNRPNPGSVNRQVQDESNVANGGSSNEKKEVTKAANSLGGDILDSLFEKPDSWRDLADPIFDRITGLGANTAIAFGYTDLSAQGLLGVAENANNLINDLVKELNAEGALNNEFCKVIAPEVVIEDVDPSSDSESLGDSAKNCLNKSSLFKSAKGDGNSKAPIDIISNIFSVVSELTKPADPAECINPYFEQFFNLIPVQFIISATIRKLIKEQLGNLTEQQIEATLRKVNPCGQELSVTYSSSNPGILYPDLLPLFKLPKIPSIPNINLYTVLHKLIVELICFATCVALTKFIASLSKSMLEFLNENFNEERVGGSGNFTELVGNALADLDLNEEITDEILTQAILQNKVAGFIEAQLLIIGDAPKGAVLDRYGFYRQPTEQEKQKAIQVLIAKIRKYFDSISAYESEPYKKQIFIPSTQKYEIREIDPATNEPFRRKLGTKELIYMMFGEYTCLTMADLIRVGKEPSFADGKETFDVLRLNSEKRIVEFFRFLGIDFDPIATVEKLKKKACPPLPCEEIEEKTIEDLNKRLAELCKVLNFNSGLPPIPINKILSSVGLGDLFNDGIKEQFKQLKTEQLLYLGYPSVKNYPTLSDLNPFPPPENNNLDDYELWTEQEVSDEKVFKEFLLRGGPPLQWKYDQYNLNEDLQGSTLEDVCGEEETFEETFIHIFNDVFELDYAKIQETTQQKQKDYKKQYEERVKFEYDRRAPTETNSTETEKNPCCKFKDFNYTVDVSGLFDKDIITLGPAPENDPPGGHYHILRDKLHKLWNATRGKAGGTDNDKVYNIIENMSDEEKCYVCRRVPFAGGNSILKDIENDMNKNQRNVVYNDLDCKESFGYSSKRGAVEGHTKKEGTPIDLLVKGKCPKD